MNACWRSFSATLGLAARTLFLGLPQRAAYSQEAEAFYVLLAQLVNDQHIDRVIVITSLSDGARYPLVWIEPGLQRLQLQGVATEHFEAQQARMDVYRRTRTTVSIQPTVVDRFTFLNCSGLFRLQ